MDSYAERLSESALTSRNTSVTAFLLPEQVTLWEARSGPNGNLKPGSAPASATSIIRSSCDTAAMCLGLFLRNGKGELESSRIWLASVGTGSPGREGDPQGSGNGIKNFDLVIQKQTLCTDDTTRQKPFFVEPLQHQGLWFQTMPRIWMRERTQSGPCGTPRLYQQGLRKDTDRGDVSAHRSTDPAPPSHLVPWARLMEKGSEAFPCFYMTEPCHSLTLLTSSFPFASLSITDPLWYQPEWITFILLVHLFRRWNGCPSCQTFDFISLCLRKWIILSLITERKRISVTLKIERSTLWAFPLLHLIFRSEWANIAAFCFCKEVLSAGVWSLQMRHTTARRPRLKHCCVRHVLVDTRS